MSSAAGHLRVAIIGAGPAGLALASTLVVDKTSTHRITLYEASSSFREIGVGLSISGRTFSIARAIGIEDALKDIEQEKNKPNATFESTFRKSDDSAGHEFCRTDLGRGAGFHRAQFRDVLAQHISQFDQVEIKFGKRLSDVVRQDDGSYELSFSDDTRARADIVVGADGVKSPVRHAMFRIAAHTLSQPELNSFAPAVWSGQRAYRTAIHVDKFREVWSKHAGANAPEHRVFSETAVIYCGKGNHIPTYLIAGRTLVNTLLFSCEFDREGEILPDDDHVKLNVDTSHLLEVFKDWELEVRVIVEAMGTATLWAINVVKKLPFFAHGGIAVMGDAAHAMPPHLANGANQAVEDAYVLGRVLTAPGVTRENVHHALEAYSVARMPRAQAVAAASKEFGLLMDWSYTFPGEEECGTDEQRQSEAIKKFTGWVPMGNPEDELKIALDRFYESTRI